MINDYNDDDGFRGKPFHIFYFDFFGFESE